MTHTWRPLGNYSIYPDSSMTDVTWIMVDEIINTLALHGDLDADVMVDGEEWHCIVCADHDDKFYPWLAYNPAGDVASYTRFGRGSFQAWIDSDSGD